MKTLLPVMLAALLLSAPAWAQPPGPEGPGPQGPGPRDEQGPPPEHMGLTEEQTQKLEDIRLETDKIVLPLEAQVEVKERELQRELKKEACSKTVIDQLIKDISALQEKIMRARIDSLLKTKTVLTAEQFRKMVGFLGFMKGRKNQGGGPGGEARPQRSRK